MSQDAALVDCDASDGPKIQNAFSRLKDEEAILISRLASLHSSMREHEIHIARLKNLRTPIFSIPPELLAAIFLAGSAWSRAAHNISISHVCHNWRDIALSLPALWTFFDLSPTENRPGRLEIISMFLERSCGHPLDVSIRFDDDGEANSNYDSDNDGEDLRYDRPDGRLASQGAILFPTLARWRVLSIHNLNLPNHHNLLEPLWEGPAPILEKMDLMCSRAPQLAQITTRALAFSFLQCQSITELVFEDPISSHVYEQILHSSPQLIDLQFKGDMSGLAWSMEDIRAVELPFLRRLTITLTDCIAYSLPDYLPILLHSLRAPVLEAFTINFCDQSTFSAAADSAFDSPSVASIYTPVRSLSLIGANLNSKAAARIAARFPSVTHISLTNCPSLSPLFQHLLDGSGHHNVDVIDGPSKRGGIAWPFLQAISISERMLNKTDTEVLCKLVINRDARGIPLSSWTMGNCTLDVKRKQQEAREFNLPVNPPYDYPT